jgi:hypothetical protein
MKKWIVAMAVLLALAAWLWLRKAPADQGPVYATPNELLDAYFIAAKQGDAEAYLWCLAEPLRLEVRMRFPDEDSLGNYLRSTMGDLKNWVHVGEAKEENDKGQTQVDELFATGRKRLRISYEKHGPSWRISGIDPPEEIPQLIPLHTNVSEVPEGP